MHFEQVKRKMFGLQRQRLFDVSLPAFECLAWQSRNQVEADVCKSGVTQIGKRSQCVCCAVGSSQLRQLCVVKSLRAETGPIDAQSAEVAKLFGRRAAGINFECDLRCLVDLETIKQGRQNLVELRWRKQRRRAATKIDRVYTLSRKVRRAYFANERANVAFCEFALIKARGEVAIRTTRTTKRNMNVETCGCHLVRK